MMDEIRWIPIWNVILGQHRICWDIADRGVEGISLWNIQLRDTRRGKSHIFWSKVFMRKIRHFYQCYDITFREINVLDAANFYAITLAPDSFWNESALMEKEKKQRNFYLTLRNYRHVFLQKILKEIVLGWLLAERIAKFNKTKSICCEYLSKAKMRQFPAAKLQEKTKESLWK